MPSILSGGFEAAAGFCAWAKTEPHKVTTNVILNALLGTTLVEDQSPRQGPHLLSIRTDYRLSISRTASVHFVVAIERLNEASLADVIGRIPVGHDHQL